MPCMRVAANLELEASPEEQKRAKEELRALTNECSDAIKLLAQREFEKISSQLKVRCEEVDEQLKGLPAPEPYKVRAIAEGVKESREQARDRPGDFEGITDYVLG